MKRELLACAVREDPDAADFEAFLLRYAGDREGTEFAGAASAMARMVLEEWRLAHAMADFAAWLQRGAPSEDAAAS